MNLDDTAVDHGVFEIRIFCQGSEHMVKCVGFHPSADALEHRVPLAELRRKVAPWAAGSRDPEHRLDEQPIVSAGATGITVPAKAVWGNDCPLRLGQRHADQGYLPFGILESVRTRFGNPQTSTDLSQTEVDEFTKFYRGPLVGTQIPAVGKKPFTKICRSNFSVPVGSV